MLTGNLQSAPAGARGFDTDTVLTPETAQVLAAAGFVFCARYLSLAHGQRPGDLSIGEAEVILAAGLALFPVQHVDEEGWHPGAALGSAHGQTAAANASQVGFPSGVCIALDLEGIEFGSQPKDVIEYCNGWFAQVRGAGFVPLLYVGPACILDGQQLYDLEFERYWKSAADVPSLPARGYCLEQGETETVEGIEVDPDTTADDAEGGAVTWLAPA